MSALWTNLICTLTLSSEYKVVQPWFTEELFDSFLAVEKITLYHLKSVQRHSASVGTVQ